jgi:hypothetical protein
MASSGRMVGIFSGERIFGARTGRWSPKFEGRLNVFKTTYLAACAIAALLSSTVVVLANDVVIQGGRVIDPETGLDAIRNVAIEGDKIVAISEFPLEGDVMIDATGHVVSPGFIDLHAHGQNIGDYRMQVTQGVTTSLELESGVLPIADWYDTSGAEKLADQLRRSAGWTLAGSRRLQRQILSPQQPIFRMPSRTTTGRWISRHLSNPNRFWHWSNKA